MKQKLIILTACVLLAGCAKEPRIINQTTVNRDLLSDVTTFTESTINQDGEVEVSIFVSNPHEYPVKVFELKQPIGGQR